MSSKKAKTKRPAPAKKAAAKPAVKSAAPSEAKTAATTPQVKPATKAAAAKPAAKTIRTKGRGVRYDASKKQEVIDFAIAHNLKKGHGGQSAAARRFGISILTVSSWLKGSGSKTAKAPKTTKAAKAGKAAPAPKASAALTSKVKALLDLSDRIRKAEAELAKLQDQYSSLSASIRAQI